MNDSKCLYATPMGATLFIHSVISKWKTQNSLKKLFIPKHQRSLVLEFQQALDLRYHINAHKNKTSVNLCPQVVVIHANYYSKNLISQCIHKHVKIVSPIWIKWHGVLKKRSNSNKITALWLNGHISSVGVHRVTNRLCNCKYLLKHVHWQKWV